MWPAGLDFLLLLVVASGTLVTVYICLRLLHVYCTAVAEELGNKPMSCHVAGVDWSRRPG